MNVNMWENPANLRNIELLKKDNIHTLTSNEQAAVMWEWRMEEPKEIVKKILS